MAPGTLLLLLLLPPLSNGRFFSGLMAMKMRQRPFELSKSFSFYFKKEKENKKFAPGVLEL